MSRYLLDTNICIAYFKAVPKVVARFRVPEEPEPFISVITLAELKFGAANSARPDHHDRIIQNFLDSVEVLGIVEALDVFAIEKARLTKTGDLIPDFDLLIGATAIAHGMSLVTNNTKHFQRLKGIKLEDWTR